MDELQKTKQEIRDDVAEIQSGLAEEEVAEKATKIEDRLHGFANFLESNIVLLYVNGEYEVPTGRIIKNSFGFDKIIVIPGFDAETHEMKLMKIDHPDRNMVMGSRNILEPDANRCRRVPLESIDIAIIPGIAFDEKGGRIGTGQGYYDRLIPKLSITTRKVGLAFEEQMVPQVPIESHDRHVDIIITEKRIIYKI